MADLRRKFWNQYSTSPVDFCERMRNFVGQFGAFDKMQRALKSHTGQPQLPGMAF
jgi:hypothetical protein